MCNLKNLVGMKKRIFIYTDSPRSPSFNDYLIDIMEKLAREELELYVKMETARWEGKLKEVQEKIDEETARGSDYLLVCLSHASVPDDLPPLIDDFKVSNKPIMFLKVGDAFYDDLGTLEDFLQSKTLHEYGNFFLLTRDDDLSSLF
jgi:hypothetical protein